MKRLILAILAVLIVLAGCAAAADKPSEAAKSTTEYAPDDISAKLQADIDKVMTSLGIIDYEITETDRESEASDSYVFGYVIKTGGVEMEARGRGRISGGRVSASLAYVARADNKIVWSSTPAKLYDWKTGKLKP